MNQSMKELIDKKIGENIRILRKERNTTIKEMANILDISPGYMGLLENGKRGISLERLVELCWIFNVSADFLLGLDLHNEERWNTPDYISAHCHQSSIEPEYISFVLRTIKLAHELQQKYKTTAPKTTKNNE